MTSAKDFLSSGQFKFLYHGTDSDSARNIDTQGLNENIYGGVYGSETYERAAARAVERTREVNKTRGPDQINASPRMVEFWAHRDELSRPMSKRHDQFHHGNVPVQQIHSIYEIDE